MTRKNSFIISFVLFQLFCPLALFCQSDLQELLNLIASSVHGNVGVYVSLIETGEHVSINGSKHFPMQSVYKFPIAMAVLHDVDQKKLKIDQLIDVRQTDYIPASGHSPLRDDFPNGTKKKISELIRYSVSESDGSASDVLCGIIGGINNADNYIKSIRINDMQIAILEKIQVANDTIQYENWSTPDATGQLFRLFYTKPGLSPQSKALLWKDLAESSPGQHRIKGLLPARTIVAHKTGTSRTQSTGLTRATNDAGIIVLPNGRHLIVVVYISDCYDREDKREAAIAQIAKAAYDYFVSDGTN